MLRRRIRAHYQQLSEFERVRIIGLKERGWANRRIPRHMGRSDLIKHFLGQTDPSPIKHVWDMMGRRMHLPGNIENLVRQLKQIWQEIPQETIRDSAILLKNESIHTIEELSNSAQNQVIVHMDGSSDSDLDKCTAEIYLIHQMANLSPIEFTWIRFPQTLLASLWPLKKLWNNYHNRPIESSSGILLFSGSKSAAVVRSNSQLTQDIIVLINRVVAAQRIRPLPWIPAHVYIFGNKQAVPRRSKIPLSFLIALSLPMLK
ncbi:uncharacterized protein TNCV_3798001 [Trichonephila clavipes]|nr:uncharacterized protein TNCV_3798001 [Trichonephila clavipes]